jgi:hypothetical protein
MFGLLPLTSDENEKITDHCPGDFCSWSELRTREQRQYEQSGPYGCLRTITTAFLPEL